MFCPKCGKEIPDESKFCPFCGEKILPGEKAPEQPSEPVPAPKKSNRKLILIPVIAVVLVAAVLVPYLVKQNGYKKMYNQAVSEINAGKYAEATDTIIQLMTEKPDYEGADEVLRAAALGQSKQLAKADKYVEALELLTLYQDIDDSLQEELKQLQDEAYDRVVSLYRAKEYGSALHLLAALPEYPDTTKYSALLLLHLLGDELDSETVQSSYLALRDNLLFEDTKEVLVSCTSVTKKFLAIRWETTDGKYFLQVQSDRCGYSLPAEKFDTYESGINLDAVCELTGTLPTRWDKDYSIMDGFYSITNGVEEKTLFKITVVSNDKINVYCYKDGMTYQMIRKS